MLSAMEAEVQSVSEENIEGHSSQNKIREAAAVSSPKLDKSGEGEYEIEKVPCKYEVFTIKMGSLYNR